ncbi:MAG: YfhO family protein, partial [Candidatus Hydrogenedentes bacterium]|nr:YfhO family protein [Candidatus Hydrogenedentota bacterium]
DDAVASWDVSPQATQPSLLNFMVAKAILASPESGLSAETWSGAGVRLREVESSARGRILVNESALPRAFWVPKWRMVDTVTAALDAMAEVDFDATGECIVAAAHGSYLEQFLERIPSPTKEPAGSVIAARLAEPREDAAASALSAPDENGEVPRFTASACSLEELSPEHVAIHVEAPRAGIVVLSDSFGKGWRATLDGTPCEILRVNGIFRGIATPPGTHNIDFTYRPASLFVGLAVSLIGLALLIGSIFAAAFRR